MVTYEIRFIDPDGTTGEQGGFTSPGEMGEAFAGLGREAAGAGKGTLQFQTRAVDEDGSARPLSEVEEAALRAGMDQQPGLDYREETS